MAKYSEGMIVRVYDDLLFNSMYVYDIALDRRLSGCYTLPHEDRLQLIKWLNVVGAPYNPQRDLMVGETLIKIEGAKLAYFMLRWMKKNE